MRKENKHNPQSVHIYMISICYLFIAIVWNGFELSLSESPILAGNGLILIISYMKIGYALYMNPYSLSFAHWLFVFLFWGVAPIVKIFKDYDDWGLTKTGEEATLANLMLMLWVFSFSTVESIVRTRYINSTAQFSQAKGLNEKERIIFFLCSYPV